MSALSRGLSPLARLSFRSAVAGVALGGVAVLGGGCSALGGGNLGTLPEGVHVAPAPAEVAANPCRYGDLNGCLALCKTNDVGSCNAVGVIYEYGSDTEEDHGRAASYYLKACGGDYPPACNNLAWLYAVGRGVPRDPPRSLALFTRAYDGYRMACGHGDTIGCIEAAEMMIEGRGTDEDVAGAVALLERACAQGNARGCTKAEAFRE